MGHGPARGSQWTPVPEGLGDQHCILPFGHQPKHSGLGLFHKATPPPLESTHNPWRF